ncbi:ankyrin repeat domain-containing protein [Massilia sp. Dwa41.01b]|uniref:ankyrin repeat domain-containing protein n=1 Tax=unclassified Massilia TaxID=2609279 RepID=UPI0015FF6796|nr:MULTISPECIES: ankyrin repeat domain-containing protein [unclassified Massilia]QNA87917.1 ankyrin repeat domain-containing protein [Massilia sp. Dwa41.01b]QNA98820.1 ankyrin repeat domain-containing protein [Massilia sp. Se16.2.3]
MKANKQLKASWLVALMAAALLVSAPARADKVLCDGNPLCLVVAVPYLLGRVAIDELTKPPKDQAALYVHQGKVAELERLLRAKPDLARDPDIGHGLLVNAAATGNLAMTRLLVEAGASPTADHSRALGAATSTEVIAYLIARGAVASDVNLAYISMHMTHERLPELLTALLDARGPLDPNDPGAVFLLHSAAINARADVASLLLQRGVDPNGGIRSVLLTVADGCAQTRQVCDTQGRDIARALIASGAKARVIEARTGRSASEIARQHDYQELAKLLEDAGG